MNKTFKNIIYYFSALVLTKFIGIFKFFLMAKVLEPSDYGIWVILLLLPGYSGIATLGSFESLIKLVPFHIGEGNPTEAKRVENGVLGALVIPTVISIMIGFTFHLFFPTRQLNTYLPAIRLMVIATVVSYFTYYFYFRFTAHHRFKIVSMINIFRSFSTISIQVPLAFFWGLKGAALGFLISEIIMLIFVRYFNKNTLGKVKFYLNFLFIKKLIKKGFPITIIRWIYSLQATADRLITVSMLGKTASGYYGLGSGIVSIFILIPHAIADVLYPKVSEKFGRTSNKQDLISLVIKPTNFLCLLLPLIIGIIIFLLPLVYFKILPKYKSGFTSVQILILGSFFISLVGNGFNYLFSTNNLKTFLRITLLSLLVNVIGNIILIKLGLYIEGVAISTSASGILFATLTWLFIFKDLGFSKFESFKKVIFLYIPFFILLGSLVIPRLFFTDFLTASNIRILLYLAVWLTLFVGGFLTIVHYRQIVKEIFGDLKKQLKKVEI